MNKKHAKEMLRRLLATAENSTSTDQEVETAMSIARGIMQNHHLSEEDLVTEPQEQYEEIEKAPKGQAYASVGSRVFYWEGLLGTFVKEFVGGIGAYISRNLQIMRTSAGIAIKDKKGKVRSGKRMYFYGLQEDAQLAAEMYEDMRELIISAGVLKWGGCYKGDGGSYCEGFVSGLLEKLKTDQKKKRIESKSNQTGMILVERRNDLIARKEKAAKNWLAESGMKVRRGPSRSGASGSNEAYQEGKTDGKNTQLDKPQRTRKLT